MGSDIKISKTQIREVVKQGGSPWSSLISLGTRALSYATSAISKAVPALATGAMSTLGSLGIDTIFGKGVQQGGFLIPQNKIEQLIKYRHLQSAGQKKTDFRFLTNRGSVGYKANKETNRRKCFRSNASIGIALAIELASKLFGKALNISRRSVRQTGPSRGR